MPPKRLYLIDGHALCYRSFYAIKDLTTSTGLATNAVFGFITTIKKILKAHKPDAIAICFDSKEKTMRQEKFAAYKIQRQPMPDNLICQIPLIKDVARGYNIACYEVPGFEADDLIATIVEKLKNDPCEIVVVSEDKDLLQLANKKVKFLSMRNDAEYSEEDIKSQYGFHPQGIADYLALAGDSSDNIPGVKGIGKVTATKLMEEFGGLDQIYKNINRIDSASVKEKLTENKEMAYMSRDLALLDKNAPIEVSWEHVKIQSPDSNRLYNIFKELEFKKFADELSDGQQLEDAKDISVKIDEKKLSSLIAQIKAKKSFAFFSDQKEEGDSLFEEPKFFLTLDGLETCEINASGITSLEAIFEDKNILKITYDLKAQLKQIKNLEISPQFEAFDVKLAAYVLSPAQPLDLSSLAWHYLKKTVTPNVSGSYKAHTIYALFNLFAPQLKEKSLEDLFKRIEMPLTFVLFKMEDEGVCLDKHLLQRLSVECEKSMATLEKKLYELAGEQFNLNSPKQLATVLFEKLKLPTLRKTKTGFSTDEGVLLQLAKGHEFPAVILEFRQLSKLKSTYLDALPKLMDPKTTRLHADFDQTGAETGRLSSRNPNLQNIPVRTELGRQIRKAIVSSSKNSLLLAADYSQIELRILAHISQDKTLIKAFKDGEDIHCYTASLIFDVKEKDVTPEMRYATKRVNFGIIYGMSAFGLAKDLGVSQTEAQDFIDKYFLRYPNVKRFMDEQIKKCEKDGYVVTLLNRRRYIPEISSPNMAIRQFAQRQAINTPVQGSAADLMKLAMIDIQREIEKRKMKSKMIITVHDELVFDMLEDEKKELVEVVKTKMEEAISLDVPIRITMKTGRNWLEMDQL